MKKRIFKCYYERDDDYQLILCRNIEEAKNEDDFVLVEEYEDDTISYLNEDENIVVVLVKDLLEEFKDSKRPVYI